MLNVLSEAGRSFLRAFIGSMLILLPGVLAAPNLDEAFGLGVAALIASIAAGIKVIQVFVPQLSFASLVPPGVGLLLDSFARAFLASLLVLVPGVLNAPNLSEGKALAVAALIAAVTAGVRALQGVLSPEDPVPSTG